MKILVGVILFLQGKMQSFVLLHKWSSLVICHFDPGDVWCRFHVDTIKLAILILQFTTHIISHIPQVANHRTDLLHVLFHLILTRVISNLGHKCSGGNIHTRLRRGTTSWTRSLSIPFVHLRPILHRLLWNLQSFSRISEKFRTKDPWNSMPVLPTSCRHWYHLLLFQIFPTALLGHQA